ncbi:MAG TPA: choice-of-anchor tandem repeat GloVer-containing protein [Candidatus Binataceae bacterium]|nr:choice-of-anchor tandem repeat GloVer-containing protein [Candidatus Binataceae bacterium]
MAFTGPAHATESVIYNFPSTGSPAGVIVDKSGNLYGTTPGPGGSVFSLTPPAVAGDPWGVTIIHEFPSSGSDDGSNPVASLLAGRGALFGTTQDGGASNLGTVFEVTPPATAGGSWGESVLYSFTGGSDGSQPVASLIADSSGILYGTAQLGGASGLGTVFSLKPPSSAGPWTESVLHSFTGGSDGSQPVAGLVADRSGTLYGTTQFGGASNSGTVFALTPPPISGGAWSESVLYAFTGINDGGEPLAGLLLAPNGALYGTTLEGGQRFQAFCSSNKGCGVVFKLTPPTTPGGLWTESVLHRFLGEDVGSSDGSSPAGSLLAGPAGTLYGTTLSGGGSSFGEGTVFKLTPPTTPGGLWTVSVKHAFFNNTGDGVLPASGLVFSNHELFGTTESGGESGLQGTVFEVTP